MSIFALRMLSNARKKEIGSLKQKKYRQRYGQFLVEGEKSVLELCLSEYDITEILVTQKIFDKTRGALLAPYLLILSEKEIQQLSNFETPPGIIAVSNFKETFIHSVVFDGKFTLMLDSISDPGNLGTIIRIADWYGIENIICSPDTVDLYNPKTIASSMGSFTRVNVIYSELEPVLKKQKNNSFACVMNGLEIQTILKPQEGIIIIGNEANGISHKIENLASQKITIPRIGKAESLNASIAAAIVCHSFIIK
ncbi:MAG: TrmH family RNA methyltransferase [Bacteroidia bacterium]